MRATPHLLLILLGLSLLAPLQAAGQARGTMQEALLGIRAAEIRAHLAFLADDLLEGRAPGTRGGVLAARYIASQLARAGVEPVGGSYYQTVPLIGWSADPRRTGAEYTSAQRRATLRYPDDLVLWLDTGADSAAVRAEVVFAGYGVRAPEYQWDDYKGRDVRGRIVIVLSNDPPAPPGQPFEFEGPAMTYYGRYTYKIEEARRQGAAGVLIVHTTEGAGYPWPIVQSSWTGEQIALPQDSATAAAPLQVQGWITLDAARRLLAAAPLGLDELYVHAARRDFQPIFTGVTLQLRAAGRTRRFDSANVVGVVPGRHSTRRTEFVVYTAHYDHLGIGRPVNGDSIYNGAYDNASGVALLLDVAEAFASLDPKPDRTMVFLFTTGEEAGLLGSTWYVRNSPGPLQRTVAAFNIDGANVWGETEDISAVGLERSTLGVAFETAAASLGLRVEGERAPDRGFYFRSDHFPFARAGVPALYLDHGRIFRNRPAAWGDSLLTRYEHERYHQPSDEYDPTFDLAGAVQQGRLAFILGLDIANTPAPPRWYPGAEFTRR